MISLSLSLSRSLSLVLCLGLTRFLSHSLTRSRSRSLSQWSTEDDEDDAAYDEHVDPSVSGEDASGEDESEDEPEDESMLQATRRRKRSQNSALSPSAEVLVHNLMVRKKVENGVGEGSSNPELHFCATSSGTTKAVVFHDHANRFRLNVTDLLAGRTESEQLQLKSRAALVQIHNLFIAQNCRALLPEKTFHALVSNSTGLTAAEITDAKSAEELARTVFEAGLRMVVVGTAAAKKQRHGDSSSAPNDFATLFSSSGLSQEKINTVWRRQQRVDAPPRGFPASRGGLSLLQTFTVHVFGSDEARGRMAILLYDSSDSTPCINTLLAAQRTRIEPPSDERAGDRSQEQRNKILVLIATAIHMAPQALKDDIVAWGREGLRTKETARPILLKLLATSLVVEAVRRYASRHDLMAPRTMSSNLGRFRTLVPALCNHWANHEGGNHDTRVRAYQSVIASVVAASEKRERSYADEKHTFGALKRVNKVLGENWGQCYDQMMSKFKEHATKLLGDIRQTSVFSAARPSVRGVVRPLALCVRVSEWLCACVRARGVR